MNGVWRPKFHGIRNGGAAEKMSAPEALDFGIGIHKWHEILLLSRARLRYPFRQAKWHAYCRVRMSILQRPYHWIDIIEGIPCLFGYFADGIPLKQNTGETNHYGK